MKNFRPLFALMMLLQIIFWDRAFACNDSYLPVYIDVVRKSSDASSVCPRAQGLAFLTVNGRGVGFYSDGHTKGVCESGDTENILSIWSARWSGCIEKRAINANQANQFSLSICSSGPDGVCTYDTYIHRDYTLSIVTERGQPRKLIATTLDGVGATVNQSCTIGRPGESGNCLSRLDTEEILENTKAQVVALENETNQLRIDYARAKMDFDQSKAAYVAALAALNKPIDQLTEADFAEFDKASNYYAESREKFDSYKAQVEEKEKELRQQLAGIQNAATTALAGYGIDPKDEGNYIWATDVELAPITFPPLPGESALPPAENVFKILADNTIPALQAAWVQDNRLRFLEIVFSWAKKSTELLDSYKDRAEISATELSAYTEQIKRVEDFIYGVNSSDGFLTRQQWYKDSLVPSDLQMAIDNLLAKKPDDPLAIILKQKLSQLPGKNAQIDDKTFGLIVLSYSLVSYFSEFRRIYEAAVAEGYQPPPAAPPSTGSPAVFAGYSWQTLTAAYYADKQAIEEIKKAGVMGIDLYVSTSLASPLVSLCRLASGNSACRFNGEKDLTGLDYVFSGLESLALLAPVKAMLSTLKGLPLIGGKTFVVPEKILDALERVNKGALTLGLNAAQETVDFAKLLFRAGAKKAEDITDYVRYLGLSKSARTYLKIARTVEPIEQILPKLKIRSDMVASKFYQDRITGATIAEATEDFHAVRYYGEYVAGEVPTIGGVVQTGASQLGGFWGNRLYISEKSFRSGCVVFEEWNGAKRIVLIKVKKGTRIVFGKGKGQSLQTTETFTGAVKTLPDSEDWQFSFPPEQSWLDAGNPAGKWMQKLFDDGKLEVLDDTVTGWKL